MAKKNAGKKQVRRAVRAAEKEIKKMSPGKVFALFLAIVLIAAIAVVVYIYVIKPMLDEGKQGGFVPTAPAEGDLKIHFIDVGQGDCIFLQFPDGKNMIIDGGDNKKESENHIVKYIGTTLNVKTIDYMVLTHTDSDHVGGLDAVVAAFEIKAAYLPPESVRNQITTKVLETFMTGIASETGITVNTSQDDSDINGGNYTLDFFATTSLYDSAMNTAEKKNGVSPLIFLSYAERKILFTGDGNEDYTEKQFLERKDIDFTDFDVDVLKAGHHGSDTSSSAAFLSVVQPEYAVFQCGEGNSYEHPRQATIDRLLPYTSENGLYRNDLSGDIVLTVSDTGELTFETERQAEVGDVTAGADSVAAAAKTAMNGLYLIAQKMTFKGAVICNFQRI